MYRQCAKQPAAVEGLGIVMTPFGRAAVNQKAES
jgi:hypothetical protein